MAVPKRKQTPSRTGMRRSQNMKFSSKNIVYIAVYNNSKNLLDLLKKTTPLVGINPIKDKIIVEQVEINHKYKSYIKKE